MFTESVKGISRKFQGNFKVSPESFKGGSTKIEWCGVQGYLKELQGELQASFKGISSSQRVFWMVQGRLNGVLMEF